VTKTQNTLKLATPPQKQYILSPNRTAWSKVRSVLTREFTVDLDMKNAHPTILRNLCEYEFPHEEFWHALNNYVARRQEVLNGLQSAGIGNPKVIVLGEIVQKS
jgi:hypothetical protein